MTSGWPVIFEELIKSLLPGPPEDDLFEYEMQFLREADLFVYGRKTYQIIVSYWPDVAKDPSASKADRDFAQAFGSANKVVFSRSLDSAEAKKGDKNTWVFHTQIFATKYSN